MSDGHDGAVRMSSSPESWRSAPFSWRLLALTIGPGLVAMLADTDAGSIITVAQSGARWGFRLLLPNLLFIPFMFVAQEVAMRLGLGVGKGALELVRRHFGRMPAFALLALVAASCFGALVSELSGLAGAAEVVGMPVTATMILAIVGLATLVLTGSYRSVERVALFLGLFEAAFLIMAWRAGPGVSAVVIQAADMPLSSHSYLYLLAANLGTSVIPWALLYQQSASVDKGISQQHIRGARVETLVGVIFCQLVTSALLIAAGAKLANAGSLSTVGQIEAAFTTTLGPAIGQTAFILGLSGSALAAAIVVCLTLAWALGETLGVGRSLRQSPSQAPWFYGTIVAMLVAAGAIVTSGANLVNLSVAGGVVNAILLPAILAVLYTLCRKALPEAQQLRGLYSVVVAIAFTITGGVGLYAGVMGLF